VRAGDRYVFDGDYDAAAVAAKPVITRESARTSYAGLTRVSIKLHKKRFSKAMDCRVKPGNDEVGNNVHLQCCSRTPSITTVDAVLLPGMLESSQSRRTVPLTQKFRFNL
jgi:hypothetical protein